MKKVNGERQVRQMVNKKAIEGVWTKLALFFNKYLKDMVETYAPLIELIEKDVMTGRKTLVVRVENEIVNPDGEKAVRLGFYTLDVDVLPPTPVYDILVPMPKQ